MEKINIMKKWPKNNKTVHFDKITHPILNAIKFALN